MRSLVSILIVVTAPHLPVDAQIRDEAAGLRFGGGPAEAVQVPATPLRFQNLTVNDGLSEGSVHAIEQDHLGYMWFGTTAGLDRFDGYEFVSYNHIPFDSTSIAEGVINGVYEDEEGRLWITTSRGGLDMLDARRERITHYVPDENDPTSLGHDVLCKVHPSRSDALWICTLGGGLERFEPGSGTFEHFRNTPGDSTSLSNNYVYDAYEDPSGYTWVATANGLNRLNPERSVFTRYFHTPGIPQSPSPVPGQKFRYIHPDPADPYLLWLGSGDGLVRLDTRTRRYRRYLSAFVYSIVDDPNVPGVLWLATLGDVGGLYRFDTRTGRYSWYRHDPDDVESLVSNSLFSIFADRSGMIWTGSSNGRGISRFDPRGPAFRHYRANTRPPFALSLPSVWNVREDPDGRLWVVVEDAAGYAELNRIDRATGTVKRFVPDASDPERSGSGLISALHVDAAGMVWVGTDTGLERLDPGTGRVTRYNHRSRGAQNFSWQTGGFVRTIHETRSGDLWIGTSRGLYRMDRERETFTRYLYEGDDTGYIPEQDIMALTNDHAGIIWVGTMGGLYRLDPEAGSYDRFLHDPGDPSTLSENLVISLHGRQREAGILWVGTRSSGLNRFDTRTGTSTHFTTANGLPANKIYAILDDEQGRLWMSTSRGLSSFDPDAGTFTNYSVRDGLQSMEFNHGAAYRSQSGELFFGGPNGLNAFFPSRLSPNRTPPELVISDFRLFNRPVPTGPDSPLSHPIREADEVRLAHDENTVSFGFTAFHYKDPERNAYAYRLDPVDEDWIEAGSLRSATYSSLGPGTYTFHVKAANSDGVWNNEGASVRLVIAPPWWRTGWAYGLYALLVVCSVVAVDRVQRRRLVGRERERARVREAQLRAEAAQERAATLQQIDVMKSRFFANLSHEFRTPLTLILDPLEQMISGEKKGRHRRQLRLMHHQAHRLLQLIEQLLDLSTLDVGGMTLRARPMNLEAFLRNLVSAFASRAEREDIALQFAAEKGDLLLYAEPDKIEKVFTNLLMNAFKFTPSHGKIRVSLTSGADGAGAYAEVIVKDTGRGIPAEDLPHVFDRFYQADASLVRRYDGAGIGLALSRELVELHGGTIRVESEPGFGTAFHVRLRCGTDHLRPEDIVEEEAYMPADGGDGVLLPGMVEGEPGSTDASEELPDDAPTVLLVEDNEDVRTYVREHLAAHYHVVGAADGMEGMQQAQAVRPDLVIADVMMPRMDGYELCRKLKADDELGEIPVILLTAKAAEESKVEGLETGADDYIYKPFSMRELLVRVENLIEVRRALRGRFSDEVVIRPKGVVVSSETAAFLRRVCEAVEANIGNANFTVEMLAEEMDVSTRQLYRKLKKAAGLSPGGIIRTMRLQRAADLLNQGAGSIAEVAYAIGFNDPDYFSRLFRQTYGMPPSEYATNL